MRPSDFVVVEPAPEAAAKLPTKATAAMPANAIAESATVSLPEGVSSLVGWGKTVYTCGKKPPVGYKGLAYHEIVSTAPKSYFMWLTTHTTGLGPKGQDLLCFLRAAHPDLLIQQCTFAGSNIKRTFKQ